MQLNFEANYNTMHKFFDPFPVVETARLRLRQMRYTDDKLALRARSEPEVLEHLLIPVMSSLEEVHAWMDKMNNGVSEDQWVYWGIADKTTDQFMGYIALWKWDRIHRRCEVGYTLLPEYWRKGYMTEAIRAAVDFGKTRMQLHSIEAYLSPENKGSLGALTNAGFQSCGVLRENVFLKGQFRDTLVMDIVF